MPTLTQNIKAGAHFLRSYSAFQYRGRPRPMSAVFVVCNRCNLTCRYCNSPFLEEKELGLDDIEKLFRNLLSQGIYRLGLTGGEPLLREDLGEIIAMARRLGFYISLNSNLLLYQKSPEVFENIDFVFTSLDGPQHIHEKNRGRGSYAGVIDAIDALRRRGKPVIAICVVDELSNAGIAELVSTAEEHRFKLHFQVKGTSSLDPVTNIIRGNFTTEFAGENYRKVWRDILDLKKTTKAIASSRKYLESVIGWQDYREIRANREKSKCAAGFGYIYITSEGLAYPCCLIKKSVKGINMLEANWMETYKGDKPCNECICGPYLQLNLLYTQPMSSIFDLYSGYGALE